MFEEHSRSGEAWLSHSYWITVVRGEFDFSKRHNAKWHLIKIGATFQSYIIESVCLVKIIAVITSRALALETNPIIY